MAHLKGNHLRYLGTENEIKELNVKIAYLDNHMHFDNLPTPFSLSKYQFEVYQDEEAVEISPIGGNLPFYHIYSTGRDGSSQVLDIHTQKDHVVISLKPGLEKSLTYEKFKLFYKPKK